MHAHVYVDIPARVHRGLDQGRSAIWALTARTRVEPSKDVRSAIWFASLPPPFPSPSPAPFPPPLQRSALPSPSLASPSMAPSPYSHPTAVRPLAIPIHPSLPPVPPPNSGSTACHRPHSPFSFLPPHSGSTACHPPVPSSPPPPRSGPTACESVSGWSAHDRSNACV